MTSSRTLAANVKVAYTHTRVAPTAGPGSPIPDQDAVAAPLWPGVSISGTTVT